LLLKLVASAPQINSSTCLLAKRERKVRWPLPLQTQLLDQIRVLALVVLLEVAKVCTAVRNHLEKASAGVEIFRVLLEVLGKLLDLAGKQADLHRSGAGVSRMHRHAFYRGRLHTFRKHWQYLTTP